MGGGITLSFTSPGNVFFCIFIRVFAWLQLIQTGYAKRVLRVFNMWECNQLDPNVRLSKLDCPEVLLEHRKYRSIVGCLWSTDIARSRFQFLPAQQVLTVILT
jgi:hypothetical protein